MKKVFFSIVLCFMLCINAHAGNGESNINSGGGKLCAGTHHSYWIPGNEGVRITVIDAENGSVVSNSFDLSNVRPNIDYHFGYTSKLHYMNGHMLSPMAQYENYEPIVPLPQIISDIGEDSTSNVNELRHYFCDEQIIHYISELTNISYATLVSGKYKLLIEPVVYMKFLGNDIAITATEAALLNKKTSGQLYAWMRSLTHQNLPFSMFLEKDTLGIPAYHGNTSSLQSDDFIFYNLGLGIVSFTNNTVNIHYSNNSYTYRTDTEVITPVSIFSSNEISPKDPATITFSINGRNYVTKTIVPENQYQLVFIKWRTPSTPKQFTIDIYTDKGQLCQEHIPITIASKQINCEPSDPKATDKKKLISNVMNYGSNISTASWELWIPIEHKDKNWHSNWNWNDEWVDLGSWNDHTWFEYKKVKYMASLVPKLSISPDDVVPNRKNRCIKSGYGIKCNLHVQIKTNAPNYAVTHPQNAEMFFPEFQYKNYSRILDISNSNVLNTDFCFFKNKFSTYNRRAHYIPLWFPDKNYTVNTHISECWTPAGMISTNIQDNILVSGNMYSDWHNAIS